MKKIILISLFILAHTIHYSQKIEFVDEYSIRYDTFFIEYVELHYYKIHLLQPLPRTTVKILSDQFSNIDVYWLYDGLMLHSRDISLWQIRYICECIKRNNYGKF